VDVLAYHDNDHVCRPFALQQESPYPTGNATNRDISPLKVEDAKPRDVTVAKEGVTKRMERKASHQVRLDDTFILPDLSYRVILTRTRLVSYDQAILLAPLSTSPRPPLSRRPVG